MQLWARRSKKPFGGQRAGASAQQSEQTLRRAGRVAAGHLFWFGARLGVLAFFIGLWQLALIVDPDLERFLSSPSRVREAIFDALADGKVWRNLAATLKATALGFLIGTTVGAAVGFALAMSVTLDRLLDPWVAILNSLPRVALAPLFILWFGISMQAKIALAVSIVFFVQLVATRSGIKNIDSDLLLVTRLAALSRFQIVRKVVLPGSMPSVFAGLRLSLVYSLLGVVTSEMLAARDGLGQLIVFETNVFRVHNTFALLALLAAVAAIANELMRWFERWVLRWQAPAQ